MTQEDLNDILNAPNGVKYAKPEGNGEDCTPIIPDEPDYEAMLYARNNPLPDARSKLLEARGVELLASGVTR